MPERDPKRLVGLNPTKVTARTEALDVERAILELQLPGNIPHDVLPREWTLFDLSDCPHPVRAVTQAGGWDVETCDRCGEQVSKHCRHERSLWSDGGKILVCVNCGVDGT